MNNKNKNKTAKTRKDYMQVYFERDLYHHLREIATQESREVSTSIKDVAERAVIAGLRALNYPEYSTKNERVAS